MVINVPDLIAPMVAVHKSGVNHSLEWRKHQLNTLMLMVTECEKDFTDALYIDLRKERTECMYSEILVVKREITTFLNKLNEWMVPKKVATPSAASPSICEILSVPLSEPGVLVIGPFNYPVTLALMATVGAFGGGNPVVFKPSEQASTVSATFAKLVPKYFEKGAFQIVEGGTEETSELMKQHWGMVHFTGSERVGKIIQQSAAKTLSPTILELGGKTPSIIAEDCPDDISVVCDRLISGKLLNCGQTCVSPDYVLVHESKLQEFNKAAICSLEKQFGKDQKDSASELGRIITECHAQRHVELIEEVEQVDPTKVIYGGSKSCSPVEKYVAPTLLLNPPFECRVMKEEIFGPILPVISYQNDDDMFSILDKMPATPLSLYVFTKSRKRYENIVRKIPSGSAIMNDTILQLFIPDFPFGGIGTSGIGNYHGEASFTAFTHKKTSQYHLCIAAADAGGLR